MNSLLKREIHSLPISWDYRRCLLQIAEQLQEDGYFSFNRKKFAQQLGVSERTVSRYFQYLRVNNYLELKEGCNLFGGNGRKIYMFKNQGKNDTQLHKNQGNEFQRDRTKRIVQTYKVNNLLSDLTIKFYNPFRITPSVKGHKMSSKVDNNTLEKLQSTRKRIHSNGTILSREDQGIVNISDYYSRLATERKGSFRKSLPSLIKGIEHTKKGKNWKHFSKVYEICQELDIDFRLWLEAQFDITATHPSESIQNNSGIPYPNMLYGDWALKKFSWYLDKTENLTEKGEPDYATQRMGLGTVWEGPINLANKLISLLKQGEKITHNSVVVILCALPGMFEPEYILLNSAIGREVSNSMYYKYECNDVMDKIKRMGKQYEDELANIYERSLVRVKETYPDEFEEISQWL